MTKKLIYSVVFIFISTLFGYSQEALKSRPSPTAIVTMKYEDTYVKVTYCQPHKLGRKIFGHLVPYGQIWRTGANEATELTVTRDILIGGEVLAAGTYSIFTIPNESDWTIIFNKGLGQWGHYTYNEELDVLRAKVKATNNTADTWEPFTIAFEQANEKALLTMQWDRTKVEIPLEFKESR